MLEVIIPDKTTRKKQVKTNELWLIALDIGQMVSSCISGWFLAKINCNMEHSRLRESHKRMDSQRVGAQNEF